MLHIIEDDGSVRTSLMWSANLRKIPCAAYENAEQFVSKMMRFDATRSDKGPGASAAFPYDAEGDCVILDVHLGNKLSGVELFHQLAEQKLLDRLLVIFVTGNADVALAVDALKHGAFDFVVKPARNELLLDRVVEALAQSKKAGQSSVVRQRLSKLTHREREVLHLMLMGKINKVIGSELGISMRTVEMHRASVFVKMKIKTPVELAGMLFNQEIAPACVAA